MMELFFGYTIATILFLLPCICLADVAAPPLQQPVVAGNGLRVGFYEKTCPQAEKVVEDVIKQEVARHPGISAGFIRLHFHDCFVRGCDGSVLLNGSGQGEVEMGSGANIGLRGFTGIEAAKARLEAECPNTVSCADIVTFAARDAAVMASLPYYPVPSGRRDGTVSNATEVYGNLPVPFSRDVNAMTTIFAKKGLSTLDLVTLLGAHSMGRLHCKVIETQLNSANAAPGWTANALGIDQRYKEHLRQRCPEGHHEEATVSLNPSPVPQNRILSNKYYENVVKGKVALESDQALINNTETKGMVMEMAANAALWTERFRASMVKMGMIEVLTGTQGEIRKTCSLVNK